MNPAPPASKENRVSRPRGTCMPTLGTPPPKAVREAWQDLYYPCYGAKLLRYEVSSNNAPLLPLLWGPINLRNSMTLYSSCNNTYMIHAICTTAIYNSGIANFSQIYVPSHTCSSEREGRQLWCTFLEFSRNNLLLLNSE